MEDHGFVNDDDKYGSDDEQNNDNYDEDYEINEYENQDQDIDESLKKKVEKDDEDELFDIDQIQDFDTSMNIYNNPKRKKTSGIIKMSDYEFAKLYGTITDYIVTSRIEIPEEMEKEEEVKSGDAFRIARFWINNRKKYPLNAKIERQLYGNVKERVDPTKLLTNEDLEFNDDNTDSYKFVYNFRDKPYNNSA